VEKTRVVEYIFCYSEIHRRVARTSGS